MIKIIFSRQKSRCIQPIVFLILIFLLVACKPEEMPISEVEKSEKIEEVAEIEVVDDIEEIEPMVMTDVDGNIYETVMIGDQVWMAENLRVTHYNDGSEIEFFSVNGESNNDEEFGLLYDFVTVNNKDKNISPDGWHVPTKEDWEVLILSLGGLEQAGTAMKEPSLFGAQAAGMHDFTNIYQWFRTSACFSTSTKVGGRDALYYFMNMDEDQLIEGEFHPNDAVSVRLIKDTIEGNTITSAYNQAYQENYETDGIEYILENANNSYVLLDPFTGYDLSDYMDRIKANNNELSAYISIGTGEEWRDDFEEMVPFLVSRQWGEWEGEYFVDATNTGIIDVMKKRISVVAEMGFDWVEFDNMDWAFDDDTRTEYGFEATEENAIEYYTILCEYAHQKGLKCMAKNLTKSIDDFDGVTLESYSEDMNWWDEEALKEFISKGKVILINHYNETDSDGVHKYYVDIYGEGILFISEDRDTKRYKHY